MRLAIGLVGIVLVAVGIEAKRRDYAVDPFKKESGVNENTLGFVKMGNRTIIVLAMQFYPIYPLVPGLVQAATAK